MKETPKTYLTTGGSTPFLPELIRSINQADQIMLAVAFVKRSGLSLILPVLEDAVLANKRVRLLTGDYLNLTEPAALRLLLPLQSQGLEVRVFESKGISFHPKAYIFFTYGEDPIQTQKGTSKTISQGHAFIGSSNLSASALKDGIEWNIRIDKSENPARFTQLLESYEALYLHEQTQELTKTWIDTYIERYQSHKRQQIEEPSVNYEPTPIQLEALAALNHAREKGYQRGLVVMATGLGKTWLSAFDSLDIVDKDSPHILFVAHRQEILQQAEATFLNLYPEAKTGYFLGDKKETDADILFASIFSLGKPDYFKTFSPEHFEYIVIDEFHHAAAKSYRQLLRYFKPTFLLGLTATPDRTDGADIEVLCDGNRVYTIDLIEGIERQYLCPFVYYGIPDPHVDYQRVGWNQGQFVISDLEQVYQQDSRANHILNEWKDKSQTKTLAFCTSKAHAEYMSHYFNQQQLPSAAVYSGSKVNRNQALKALEKEEIKVLFSVDLFNEGVDLPDLDTVMFLRPTESKILFLQQLGRGLRRSSTVSDKRLHVLDFIGNHQVFLNRPQALLGVSASNDALGKFFKDVRESRLQVPMGCEFHYDEGLQVISWMESFIRPRADQRLIQTYERLKILLGDRPSALEFFQSGEDMKKIAKKTGHWFAFIKQQEDLSPEELNCLETYEDFFKHLETMDANKSYKWVTLEALIQLGGFIKPISISELCLQSFDILCRREKLRHKDLYSVKSLSWIHQVETLSQLEDNQKEWIRYWKKNPIEHLTNQKKSKSSS